MDHEERDDCGHRGEVNVAREVIAAEQRGQLLELHRLPDCEPGQHHDDTGQARTLWEKVLDDRDRDHLVANIVTHAGGDDLTAEMMDRVVAYWTAVTPELGRRVADGLGRSAPVASGNGAVSGAGR